MSSVEHWELQQWAIPKLGELLPLNESELEQIVAHTSTLSEAEGAAHLEGLLGDSDEAVRFTSEFYERRSAMGDSKTAMPAMTGGDEKRPVDDRTMMDVKGIHEGGQPAPQLDAPPVYAPPPGPPPPSSQPAPVRSNGNGNASGKYNGSTIPPTSQVATRHHTNQVIEAARVRAKDEQEMQQMLQNLQYQYRIYNSDIEPEHETDYYCSCPIHQYKMAKYRRYPVQDLWSKAVMYPGEHAYNDNTMTGVGIFGRNPYQFRVNSPYGYSQRMMGFGMARPVPSWHARNIHQTIDLNNSLNREAQQAVDKKEPTHSIWEDDPLESAMSSMQLGDKKKTAVNGSANYDRAATDDKAVLEKRQSLTPSSAASERPKASKLSSFRKSLGIKSTEERAIGKAHKAVGKGETLRQQIEEEESGRWPDHQWRYLVSQYQEKVGMTRMIADLRAKKPIQYLHLLRAGYFEPIPVAWANQASNPLKFSIEAAAGWRGITPAWRGYEDTAEERLYWVLNHREGSVGMRMKPDFISEMNMARERMAKAVEPPPLYFDPRDTCHLQHTSEGYSKQVMPAPFRAFDRPEVPTDDTMILLDVSGSMDFDPVRPVYNQYLIEGFAPSTQPKNKDVAKAIIRRFCDAMANHDHTSEGYDLTTFSSKATYIGTVNHRNLDEKWRSVRIGGGTRVMTGWQKVKDLHFQKHSESAMHHPVYGWQAGPETPMLRLLLLLDGEATDMDEFELDLLGLSWAHVTIFLIGVDGCPHHHRHANELQRISDVNHHVSFVDAQGNTPERFVTHELLKRHLGYDISLQEFETMEELPAYSET